MTAKGPIAGFDQRVKGINRRWKVLSDERSARVSEITDRWPFWLVVLHEYIVQFVLFWYISVRLILAMLSMYPPTWELVVIVGAREAWFGTIETWGPWMERITPNLT